MWFHLIWMIKPNSNMNWPKCSRIVIKVRLALIRAWKLLSMICACTFIQVRILSRWGWNWGWNWGQERLIFWTTFFFLLILGFPALGIAPFDPHKASFIEQRRGLNFARGNGYRLILRKVSEFGWTNSKVTKYRWIAFYDFNFGFNIEMQIVSINYFPIMKTHRTDAANNRIIYSQYFPEKSLNGEYEFKANLLGQQMHTKGIWNMTLYDYAWVSIKNHLKMFSGRL